MSCIVPVSLACVFLIILLGNLTSSSMILLHCAIFIQFITFIGLPFVSMTHTTQNTPAGARARLCTRRVLCALVCIDLSSSINIYPFSCAMK